MSFDRAESKDAGTQKPEAAQALSLVELPPEVIDRVGQNLEGNSILAFASLNEYLTERFKYVNQFRTRTTTGAKDELYSMLSDWIDCLIISAIDRKFHFWAILKSAATIVAEEANQQPINLKTIARIIIGALITVSTLEDVRYGRQTENDGKLLYPFCTIDQIEKMLGFKLEHYFHTVDEKMAGVDPEKKSNLKEFLLGVADLVERQVLPFEPSIVTEHKAFAARAYLDEFNPGASGRTFYENQVKNKNIDFTLLPTFGSMAEQLEPLSVADFEKREMMIRLTQIKKVYYALREGETALFYKGDFMADIAKYSPEEQFRRIMEHAEEKKDSRTAKAVKLVYANLSIWDQDLKKDWLFAEIHRESFYSSGIFGIFARSSLFGETVYSNSAYKDSAFRNNTRRNFGKIKTTILEQAEAHAKQDSECRSAKILRALG